MIIWYIAGAVLFTPLAAIHWYLLPQMRPDAKPLRRFEYVSVTLMFSALAAISIAHLTRLTP